MGPLESYHRYIGPPLLRSFEVFDSATPEEAQTLLGYYRERFSTVGLFENKVYPGIPELLARLRAAGLRLAVATSKAEPYARRLLAHYEIDKSLDGIVGTALYSTTNEKVDLVRRTLRELGETDPARAVMVGDREFDVKGGRAAGVHTVGVSYGYGSCEELTRAGAEAIADSPAAVGDAILGAR